MKPLADLDKDSPRNPDLWKLLRYFLACNEEEDPRGRQVNSDEFKRPYLSPNGDLGGLFRGELTIS